MYTYHDIASQQTIVDAVWKLNLIPAVGVRKEVKVQGFGVLLFWYRNELYAIESRQVSITRLGCTAYLCTCTSDTGPPFRSPAEGAYSEGFASAKFTQVRQSAGILAIAHVHMHERLHALHQLGLKLNHL